MPAAARLRTDPGTAITSIERSIAACAVISDPPRSRLSTTTSTSLSAARMRLRSGKRNASGAVPGGHSESSTPRSQTAFHRSACWRGYGVSGPLPTTATGRPRSDREDATVGGAVDALRQARHHADPGLGEVAAEHRGDLPPDAGGVARPDDADPAGLQGGEVAADEQRRRRVRVVAQRGGELGVAQGDDADAGGAHSGRPTPPVGAGRPTPATPTEAQA